MVTTMPRCSSTSFWCQGVKVRTGEARTLIDGEWLQVVCRTAKPGEINVQQLEDHSALRLDETLTLVFERAHSKGRRGRDVDVESVISTLSSSARHSYVKRLADSRADRETLMLLARSGDRHLQRVLARNAPGVVDEVVRDLLSEAGFQPLAISALLPFVQDPVLVEQLGVASGSAYLSVMVNRLFELGDDVRARLHGDVVLAAFAEDDAGKSVYHPSPWYMLGTYPAHEITTILAGRLSGPDAVTALRAARRYLAAPGNGGIVSPTSERAALEIIVAALSQLTALERHRIGAEIIPVLEEARDTFGVTLGQLAGLVQQRQPFAVDVADSELIKIAAQKAAPLDGGAVDNGFVGWAVRNEIIERRLADNRLPIDEAMQWLLVGQQAGMSAAERLLLWKSRARVRAVRRIHGVDTEFVSRVAVTDPSHHVRRAALEVASDLSMWSHALDTEPRHWFFAEKAPLAVLTARYSTRGRSAVADLRTAEVYLRRGALPVADALRHTNEHVRVAAVRMTRDEVLLAAAAHDMSAAVRIAAGLRTLRLRTIEAVSAGSPATPELVERERVLRLAELARISAGRSDEATARGAISGITHADVLWGLHSEGVVRSRVAERLQVLKTIEPF